MKKNDAFLNFKATGFAAAGLMAMLPLFVQASDPQPVL